MDGGEGRVGGRGTGVEGGGWTLGRGRGKGRGKWCGDDWWGGEWGERWGWGEVVLWVGRRGPREGGKNGGRRGGCGERCCWGGEG